jgi:hypothetical protein
LSNLQIFQRNGLARRGSSVRIRGSRARARKVWAVRGLGDMKNHPSARQARRTGGRLTGGNNTVVRAGAQGSGYGRGFYQPNTYQHRAWNASEWHYERHPKLKTMMATYLERTNGRVHLSEILQAARKRQTNLPTLPQYVHPNGRPYLCWSSVIGGCTFRECRFLQQGGHPLTKDITDEFADIVVDTINKGVIALCIVPPVGGSPSKKPKATSEDQPTL